MGEEQTRDCWECKGCIGERQLSFLLSRCHGAGVAERTSPASWHGSQSRRRGLGTARYASACANRQVSKENVVWAARPRGSTLGKTSTSIPKTCCLLTPAALAQHSSRVLCPFSLFCLGC